MITEDDELTLKSKGLGRLDDRKIEEKFKDTVVAKSKDICTRWKMDTAFWPNTVYYAVNDKD